MFLCLNKDEISNQLMAFDVSNSSHPLRIHTFFPADMVHETGTHYLCTLLGDIYDMSAGGQDGLLTSSSLPLAPVGNTY